MDLETLRKQKQQRRQAEMALRSDKVRNDSIRTKTSSSTDSNIDAERHYQLGEWYYDGLNGYPLDRQKAFAEYHIAAELGHTAAMTELASDYSDDESILGYDLTKAEIWATKAIELGNADGYKGLFDILEQQGKVNEAIKQLEIGVSKGSLDCIEWLAFILYWGYEIGDFEIKPDEDRALKLLTSVEWDDDNSIAYELLGNIYRDQEKPYLAKEYYDKALKADPENYGVMASLGTLLRSVEEVKDYERARALLFKASEYGNYIAMNGYGVMLYLGEDTDQDVDGAIEWFKKSAEGGCTLAMINLGDIYSDNNPEEARYWYNQAKEYGDSRGEERLQEMGGSTASLDTSRSDKIFDNFLKNMENTLNLSPSTILNSGFPNRIEGIQKFIDKGDLSSYEVDRLKILQGFLSLCYFRHHFFDEDFSEKEDDYYKILDAVDDYISSMSEISDEGAYIYYIANMYSANRFNDVDPIEKLEELWTKLSEIELDEASSEFSVQYWKDTAEEVHYVMSELLKEDHSSAFSSSVLNDGIQKKVIHIIADILGLDKEDVDLDATFNELGADSLDTVDMIMRMEKEFGLSISDQEAQKIETVRDAVTYIKNIV